jgi:hypothetical protein
MYIIYKILFSDFGTIKMDTLVRVIHKIAQVQPVVAERIFVERKENVKM